LHKLEKELLAEFETSGREDLRGRFYGLEFTKKKYSISNRSIYTLDKYAKNETDVNVSIETIRKLAADVGVDYIVDFIVK
jgi:hypothetical protein